MHHSDEQNRREAWRSTTTFALEAGPHPLTAVYSGDENHKSSSSINTTGILTQTVERAATSIAIGLGFTTTLTEPVFGQSLPFTVTVAVSETSFTAGAGTPTGNVTFTVGATVLGTATLDGSGKAVLTTPAIPVGAAQTITASYGGDTNFNPNSGTTTQTVNQANTVTVVTSSPNPSLPDPAVVTLTANVTAQLPGAGMPTGTVTFTVGAATLGAVPLSGGTAVTTTTFAVAGTFPITATYGGDTNFIGSFGTTSHVVGDTPADLSVTKTDSPDPVNAGDDLTYIVTVANSGPEDATATLVDTLPAGVSFVSATPGAPTCTHAAGAVTCNLGTIVKNGGSTIVTIVVNVPLATPAGAVLVNTATVTGSRPDSDLSNNTATQETTVFRSPRVLGDCNGDEAVDRSDIFSIVRDIFDPFFPETAGCDANEDTKVDAGDVPCTALIMGAGPGVCGASDGLGAAAWRTIFGPAAGPALSMPEEASVAGDSLTVPISFAANGHPITSLVFSVDYDEDWLSFDPTDRDGNGIPDGVILNLPGAFDARVTFNANDTDGELDIFIADITPPLSAVADGIVGFVTLNVDHSRATALRSLRFSIEPAASFGSTLGLSVPGTATPTAGQHRLFLPLVVR